MEQFLRLAVLGICVSLLGALLKKDEFAFTLLLSLAAVLVGCALLLPALADLSALVDRALSLSLLPEEVFSPLLKIVGIALAARFSCALCADAGQTALASLLQTAGALCALVCALPLLKALLDLVEGYL